MLCPTREGRRSASPESPRLRSRSASTVHRGWYLCRFCSRAFKKHEHQQRHERTHTTDRPFQCSECEREFSRQDSLLRHIRINHPHEHTAKSAAEPSWPTSPTPIDLPEWPHGEVESRNNSHLDPPDPVPLISSTLRDTEPLQPPTSLYPPPVPFSMPNRYPNDIPAPYDTYPIDMSFSTFTPPMGDQTLSGDELWQLFTQDLLPGSHSLHASPRFLAELGLESGPFGGGTQMQNPADELPASRTDLYLDQPSFEGPLLSSEGTDARGQLALTATSTLASRIPSIGAEISPLSSELLELCLNMFWTRLWPTYPCMHPSTFNIRHTSAPLLINMIALGSLTLQSKDVQIKGTSLWRLVNKSITSSWEQLIETRGAYDPCKGVQLIQTLSCGLMFARASNIPAVVNAASISHSNGLRWASLAGMTRPEIAAKALTVYPGEQLSPSQLDTRWRQWAALEDMRRSMFTLYSWDCFLALAHESHPIARHMANPFSGAWDDEATYLASSPDRWRDAIDNCRDRVSPMAAKPIGHIYQYMFNSDTSHDLELASLPMMTRFCLLDGLLSLIIEVRLDHPVAVRPMDLRIIDGALARYYAIFLQRTTDPRSRSVLFGEWHRIALELGYAIAKQKGWSGPRLWESSLGRHILLHANAIRQTTDNLLLARAKVASITHMEDVYKAGVVFRDYIAFSQEHPTDGREQYSLNSAVDWYQLNDAIGTCYEWRLVDSGAPPPAGVAFVVSGATPTINGFRMGMHDLGPFITALTGLGRVWPRARVLASELSASWS